MQSRLTSQGLNQEPAKTIRAAAIGLVCFFIGGLSVSAMADRFFDDARRLLGPDDAVLVADDQDTVLFSHNADRMLVPASTLKLLTALAAFHCLGPDFRFKTDFFIDQQARLTIKGYGDPLLVSQAIAALARRIAAATETVGRTLNGIRLDGSYFSESTRVPGVGTSNQPYDAPNGALCANFNTVSFVRDHDGYRSAEPQTPLLPMVLGHIKASGLDSGRITLSHQHDDIIRYAGELFRFFLEAEGVEINGDIEIQARNRGDVLLFSDRSRHNLLQVVEKMMIYSNNFIANQILLTMGATVFGPPGTMDKGTRCIMDYSRTVLNVDALRVVEGSGISRANRTTATAMMKVLKAFAPFRQILRGDGVDRYKTGHLNGVRTRVGFIESNRRGPLRYVVFVNTHGKSAAKVLQSLQLSRF